MQNSFENTGTVESFTPAPTLNFDNLQKFRMPPGNASALMSTRYDATMLAFDGGTAFTIVDTAKDGGKERENGDTQPQPRDDEDERGADDAAWMKQLMGANENNFDAKDMKEALGRTKQQDLTDVQAALKNLKHDDAMQFLRDNFDKIRGSEKGISAQSLANEFENNKDPKQRAACIYATRYFSEFSKAANLIGSDWGLPLIDKADIDKAKKPAQ